MIKQGVDRFEFILEIFVNFDISVPKSVQTPPIFLTLLFNILSDSFLGILGNLIVRYPKYISIYEKTLLLRGNWKTETEPRFLLVL